MPSSYPNKTFKHILLATALANIYGQVIRLSMTTGHWFNPGIHRNKLTFASAVTHARLSVVLQVLQLSQGESACVVTEWREFLLRFWNHSFLNPVILRIHELRVILPRFGNTHFSVPSHTSNTWTPRYPPTSLNPQLSEPSDISNAWTARQPPRMWTLLVIHVLMRSNSCCM